MLSFPLIFLASKAQVDFLKLIQTLSLPIQEGRLGSVELPKVTIQILLKLLLL